MTTQPFPNNNIGYLCTDWQVERGLGSKTALKLIDKDENWLEQQINLQGYNQIKEIYLGEYLSGELKLYGYTK